MGNLFNRLSDFLILATFSLRCAFYAVAFGYCQYLYTLHSVSEERTTDYIEYNGFACEWKPHFRISNYAINITVWDYHRFTTVLPNIHTKYILRKFIWGDGKAKLKKKEINFRE